MDTAHEAIGPAGRGCVFVGVADVAFAMEFVPGVEAGDEKKDVEMLRRLSLRMPREVFGKEVQKVTRKIKNLTKKKNLRGTVDPTENEHKRCESEVQDGNRRAIHFLIG